MRLNQNKTDVLYFEAAGDVVASLSSWSSQQQLQSETSKTFSGQFFDVCNHLNLAGHIVSFNSRADTYSSGLLGATNTSILPTQGRLHYHVFMLLRSFYIIFRTLQYRPRYLIVNSGVANWLALAPLKLFGVKVIASLHNTLWPEGFYPRKPLTRALLGLDGIFFHSIAYVVLCVSSACVRQVKAISSIDEEKVIRHVPLFDEADFPPNPAYRQVSDKPFTITFAGRVEANKGVFDILKIAVNLRQRGYTNFCFILCGDGSDYERMRSKVIAENLTNFVVLKGRLGRQELLSEYQNAHIAIVPTRSDFAEGFAMVALEAAMLGRPVLTCRVVPAHEELGKAAILADTDDPASYADRIAELMDSPALYQGICQYCHSVRENYFANSRGMDRALLKIFQHG